MEEEFVGTLLKRLLAEKGMSQRKLARLSGVDRGYINSLIRGKGGSISLRVARQLALALNESPEIFLRSSALPFPEEKSEDLIRRALITFPDTVPIYDPEEFALRLGGHPVEPSDFIYRRKYPEHKNVVGCYAFGRCLEPEIQDGDILIVDDNAEPEVGDIAVCLVNDKLHTGKVTLIEGLPWLVNHHGQMELSKCQRSWLIIEVRRRLK